MDLELDDLKKRTGRLIYDLVAGVLGQCRRPPSC